jgi:hypothetical protein
VAAAAVSHPVSPENIQIEKSAIRPSSLIQNRFWLGEKF